MLEFNPNIIDCYDNLHAYYNLQKYMYQNAWLDKHNSLLVQQENVDLNMIAFKQKYCHTIDMHALDPHMDDNCLKVLSQFSIFERRVKIKNINSELSDKSVLINCIPHNLFNTKVNINEEAIIFFKPKLSKLHIDTHLKDGIYYNPAYLEEKVPKNAKLTPGLISSKSHDAQSILSLEALMKLPDKILKELGYDIKYQQNLSSIKLAILKLLIPLIKRNRLKELTDYTNEGLDVTYNSLIHYYGAKRILDSLIDTGFNVKATFKNKNNTINCFYEDFSKEYKKLLKKYLAQKNISISDISRFDLTNIINEINKSL